MPTIRTSIGRVIAFAVLCVLAAVANAQSGKRVAFIISNANYANESPLANPHNDARLLAGTLRSELKFTEVVEKRDLSRGAMFDLVGEIKNKARGADSVVVYYSGHGMRGPGGNYLIPVDARISSEDNVRRDGIAASDLVEVLQDSGARVALLVLDACRDNPYAKKTRSTSKGLSRMNVSGGNVLVAYATQEGNTADDGSSGNSPYAKALASSLRATDKPILAQLDEVRRSVREMTGGKQNPTREGDLEVSVYLVPPAGGGTQVASLTQRPPAVDVEQQTWDDVLRADSAAAYEAYMKAFPNGRYVARAQVRLAVLRPSQPAAPELSGQWEGSYTYADGSNGPVRFTLNADVRNGQVNGKMSEPNTFADRRYATLGSDVRGAVQGRNFRFTKTYDGTAGQTHSVDYWGEVDSTGTLVHGQWRVGSTSGYFTMRQRK